MSQTLEKEILTLAEMEARYNGEWVLIADPELDEHLRVIRGTVAFHSSDRDTMYEKAVELRLKSAATLYVGEPPDNMMFAL